MKTKDLNVVLDLIEHKLEQSKSRIVLLERRVEQLELEASNERLHMTHKDNQMKRKGK